jgi:transcriptional regulator with XRE-family HTH domain
MARASEASVPGQSELGDLSARFGLTVRRLRGQRAWSQEQLAGRAEVNRSYLGEVERGAVMPSLATAAKLAAALGLSLSTLIAQCEGDDRGHRTPRQGQGARA